MTTAEPLPAAKPTLTVDLSGILESERARVAANIRDLVLAAQIASDPAFIAECWEGAADAEAGRLTPMETVMAELRAKRA